MPRPANRLPGHAATPAKKAPGRPPKRSYQMTTDDFFPPPGLVESPAESFAPDSEPSAPLSLPISPPAEGEHALLDYFAAQALNGLLAGKLAVPNTALDPAETACLAYDYAEALVRERARRAPSPLTPVVVPNGPLPRSAFEEYEVPF